jgi:hypothetical protein
MILSFYRSYENIRTTEIICTDQDFYNAIELIKVIKGNNLAVYYKLQHPNSTSPDMEKEKYELKKKVFELHQEWRIT